MNQLPFVLIMAGGAGTRFWPASREHLPKQFLDINGSGKTLIRETVDRFLRFIPAENIFVITHTLYAGLVKQNIPELEHHQIICEPSRNNTAPSIALASLKMSKWKKDAVCIVSPADHVIVREEEFERVIKLASVHALRFDSIITLGIEPTRADTGYGYIEFDRQTDEEIRTIKSFREKPDRTTAEQYLNTGSFAWNAGIFIWKLDTVLQAFQTYSQQIYDILAAGMTAYNTSDEVSFVETEYPKTEKISVDFAILERASNVYTIPCDIGWSDLGTWNSLYDFTEKDDAGNALLSDQVHLDHALGNLIRSREDKLIVIKGLEDFIVVDTDDCLMIYPKADEQEIKALKEKLREEGYTSYL